MLSRNNEEKFESRFLTRIDVLTERVDSLAATVGTTSSGLAKKDGEIAALQRAIEARDQTLLALVEHVNRAAQTPPADVPVEATELRSLRNAVAALTKERADGVNAGQIQGLVANVRGLAERVDALGAAVAAASAPDPAVAEQFDALAAELAVVKTALEQQPEEVDALLATLRERLDELAAREPGVTRGQLEQRVATTHDALATLRQHVDTLARTLEEHERSRAEGERQLDRRVEQTADALQGMEQRVEALAAQSELLDALPARLDELESRRSAGDEHLDRRFTETGDALAKVSHRLEAIAGELERTHTVDEEALSRRVDETEAALTTIRQRLDTFHSVDEDALDRRFEQQDSAFTKLANRLETLSGTVESAASSLGDKEHELASLQRQFAESSTRIESIVDDIREALHAGPELSAASVDDLVARLERLETTARKANEAGTRAAEELSGRIDVIDRRLATVADEVSRAKTLWPVALRSLEARLEDVAHARTPEPLAIATPTRSADVSDDLLAGLRDSLQAMETVAAEMARASETLGEPADVEPAAEAEPQAAQAEADAPTTDQSPDPSEHAEEPRAAAAGANIVPLRAGDP